MVGSQAQQALAMPLVSRAAHAWHASLFAELDTVIDCLPALPAYAEILTVSADGGALLDCLLSRHPTARAWALDLSASECPALGPERRHRVKPVRPEDLDGWRTRLRHAPDAIVLNDVLHHVPLALRERFLEALRPALEDNVLLVVKEFAPGGLRSRLGWLVDCCLSGDPWLRLLRPGELRALVARVLPERVALQTPLFRIAPPNYSFVFDRLGSA